MAVYMLDGPCEAFPILIDEVALNGGRILEDGGTKRISLRQHYLTLTGNNQETASVPTKENPATGLAALLAQIEEEVADKYKADQEPVPILITPPSYNDSIEAWGAQYVVALKERYDGINRPSPAPETQEEPKEGQHGD